jgi:hypothetical protein
MLRPPWDTNFFEMVDNLANLLSILWDPSEMVIVVLVPPNITVNETDMSLHHGIGVHKGGQFDESNHIVKRNIVSFNPFNYILVLI